MIGNKVCGSGPLPNNILVCGEGPGREEVIQYKPFVGASGAELDYLYLRRAAQLNREDIYVTNIVKWRTDELDSDPTPADIARDEAELEAEIEVCNPRIIVAVGRVAARWFMQSVDVDMDKYYGTPILCPRYPSRTLLISYHPAAALRQPERYLDKLYWSFEQLGRLVRGKIGVTEPKFHYSIYTGKATDLTPESVPVSVDTEGLVNNPWGMSWSLHRETGVVVPHGCIYLSNRYVEGHNILHDAPIIRALGQEVNLAKADDSMLMAYLLPWLPRGLKPLSFKLFGIEQKSFEEVIAPAEKKVAQAYIEKVLSFKCETCKGEGYERVPYKRQPNKLKQVKCSKCGGDGTSWPVPQPKLSFNDSGVGRVQRSRSVGRRLREVLQRGTALREGWENVDSEVRHHIEGQLGILKEASLDDIHYSDTQQYAGADACLTKAACEELAPILKREGLWRVYEIDKGILPIIDRMHSNGILIDRNHFRSLETEFSRDQAKRSGKLNDIAGYSVNPSSPLQVASVLYDKFGLKPPRGQRSTDEKTLQALKLKYKGRDDVQQCISLITEYRELDKLLGTYVRPLPLHADSNGRIHTQFLLHVTNTGRLASRDPNLQNVPTRSERGRLIRKGFVAKEGCKLVSVDLDQIELRVAAHMSEDSNMIEVFRQNKDIHRTTAALIYSKPESEVTTQERLLSKTINFLILYGGGPNKLYSELSLLGIQTNKDQCVGYINRWFEAYPGVQEYIQRCHSQAKSAGYVECLFGRRRYVQGVWSCLDKIREESLRWAGNFPIQATAAGILKLWLKGIWDTVLPAVQGVGYCEPLLTIHDEVIFEVSEGLEELLIPLVVHEAAKTVNLLVPISAKGASAYDWAALK